MKNVMFFAAILVSLFSFGCDFPDTKKNSDDPSTLKSLKKEDLAKQISEDSDFLMFFRGVQSLIEKHEEWLNALDEKNKADYLAELDASIANRATIPVRFVSAAQMSEISAEITKLSEKVKKRYELGKMNDTETAELMHMVLGYLQAKNRNDVCCNAVFESYVACSFAVPAGQSTEMCWKGYLAGSASCGKCHGTY
jgi:hypothetical protein